MVLKQNKKVQTETEFAKFYENIQCHCDLLLHCDISLDCLEIWHTEGGYKGASRYQLWLEYDKQAKRYERLFTKNNTNMLSRLQGKPRMERS